MFNTVWGIIKNVKSQQTQRTIKVNKGKVNDDTVSANHIFVTIADLNRQRSSLPHTSFTLRLSRVKNWLLPLNEERLGPYYRSAPIQKVQWRNHGDNVVEKKCLEWILNPLTQPTKCIHLNSNFPLTRKIAQGNSNVKQSIIVQSKTIGQSQLGQFPENIWKLFLRRIIYFLKNHKQLSEN